MNLWTISELEVERVVAQARILVEAHERRSPTSKRSTLGEEDALFNLWFALDRVVKGRATDERPTGA